MRPSAAALAVVVSLLAAPGFGAGPAFGAEPAAGAAADGPPPWSEAAAVVPLDTSRDVILEKVVFEVRAPAAGPIVVKTTYTIANPSRRKARVRAAVPLSYEGRLDYLERTGPIRAATADHVKVSVGLPPVAVPRDELERIELTEKGPLGRAAPALAFPLEVPDYAATELVVEQTLPWTPVAPPRRFPSEKGFSLGLVGLDAWGEGRETVTVSVITEPVLLGPASWAAPAPYRYDSKGLHWKLTRDASGALALPDRFTVVVFADWADRTFAGPYFARFEVTADDAYPWDHRFFHAAPVEQKDGRRILRLERVKELIRRLDEIEQLILARNGKAFSDTFVQMRFQKEPWYKPDPTFTEDVVKPVEKWNLDYARCAGRAARTVQSALEKMKADEIPATGRRFKLLMAAFERCDEQYWNPTPARRDRPKLLQ